MPRIDIVKESPVIRTPRVMQVEGIFDVAPSQRSSERWSVDLHLPDTWNVGVIVGPSGSGKSTIARELFGDALVDRWDWPADRSVLDGFPSDMSIKDITSLLSSVGFSSPPSWVRPFHVLSNGEQFRVHLARTLAEMPQLAVIDEFTSVVDRTVAQIGSAAVAKTVRRRNQRLIAVSCHYDILEWLEPDWVYEPAVNRLTVGRLLQRPDIRLEVRRVHHSAWQLFRKHHYLDGSLNTAARCFVAFWRDVPVAFTAWIPWPSGTLKNAWRAHRTVCLPDYQGVGIGNALVTYIASVVAGIGKVPISRTSHPSMIQTRSRSKHWKMTKATDMQWSAGAGSREKAIRRAAATTRMTAGFRYVGPALEKSEASRIWG